jgi:outer membrane lipoprotein-sorting protein
MRLLQYAFTFAALAVVVTACGGSDVFSPEDVAQAAVATSETNSMRMSIRMEVTLPGSEHANEITGEGVFDNVAQRGSVTMDLGSLVGVAEQRLGTTTTVIDGTQIYMKLPFLEQVAPHLKQWIKIDLQETAKEQGIDLESLIQLGRGGDPSDALAYLRAAGDVEDMGIEEVRGFETTHYATVVDLEKVPELAPEESRERVKQSVDQLMKLTGKSTQPMDVWVDGEGLVRRLSIEQTVEQGPETSKTTTTIELYDFNSEVSIEVPPADQVSDIKDLVSRPD